jgi:dsDNA-specific endonuclease/ATPase MutS2
MGRVAHSRLDELRKCAQPMSWMDDDEVIDVLNELWSARETINDVSAKLIQDERQLAAQAAEIERLLDGNTAMLSRNIDLAAELDAEKKEVEQAYQARDVAERDRKSLAVIVETFQEMHWKLVDLFDPEMGGVSPLHYVEEQIAALRSQLEEQRKEGK